MPRIATRILLEITEVPVERLQDISRSDIRAEGLECPPELASDDVSPNYRDWYPAAWRELWESINSVGGWDANPWVWVVEFKRVRALRIKWDEDQSPSPLRRSAIFAPPRSTNTNAAFIAIPGIFDKSQNNAAVRSATNTAIKNHFAI